MTVSLIAISGLSLGFIVGRLYSKNEDQVRECLEKCGKNTTPGSIGYELNLFENTGFQAFMHYDGKHKLGLSLRLRDEVSESEE
jgi:hypothetical protein